MSVREIRRGKTLRICVAVMLLALFAWLSIESHLYWKKFHESENANKRSASGTVSRVYVSERTFDHDVVRIKTQEEPEVIYSCRLAACFLLQPGDSYTAIVADDTTFDVYNKIIEIHPN